MNRNIKNGLFGWYEKGAMEKIETLEFKKQMSCKMIYIALCSLSAKQQNNANIECYKFDIARFSSTSEKTVQRYLPELEKLDIISISPQDRESNGKFSKVKIWLKQNNLPAGHLEDSRETAEGSNCPIYINKEIKKEIDKMSNSDFEDFYKSYPRKKGKEIGRVKFLKLDKSLLPKMYKSLEQFKGQEPQFIPHFSTYINQKRWEDEEDVKTYKTLYDEFLDIGGLKFEKKYGFEKRSEMELQQYS